MSKRDTARALRRAHRIVAHEYFAKAPKVVWLLRHEETSEPTEEPTCLAFVYANAQPRDATLRTDRGRALAFERLRVAGFAVTASDLLGYGGLFELHVIERAGGARLRSVEDWVAAFAALFDEASTPRAPLLRLVR